MSIFNDKSLKGVSEAVAKIMEAEKAKMDYDKDGKVESPKAEVLGSRIRAAKAAGKLKEDIKKNEYHVSKTHKFPTKDEHAVTVKHTESGREHVHTGKGKYLSKLIKTRYNVSHHFEDVELNGADQLDEAFPTVADGEKSLKAKEGKTSSGTVTKTKTGLVHKRDYKDDDNDADDTPKKSKGYGARQNMGKRGQSDGTKKTMKESKLSFTEMLHLYNESGIEVIAKIMPEKVKFGDTEVEVIDANIVNGAVAVTVAEEVDNETFTKEVEAQKEKNAGKGKKAEVAKASVQAVKQEAVELDEALQADKKIGSHTIKHTKSDSTSSYVGGDFSKSKHTSHHYDVHDHGGKKVGVFVHEVTRRPSGSKQHSFQGKLGNKAINSDKGSEHTSIHSYLKPHLNEAVEQIDEISKETAGKYLTAPQGKGANKYKTGEGKSSYPSYEAMSKHGTSVKRAIQRADTGMSKKPSYYKEEEQLDEKLPASASAGDYIHDFVHSDNPKFAGKSTKERQKMALGAFYAKNKGK